MSSGAPVEGNRPAVSVCVPVYKAHPEPNLETVAERMPAALDGLEGELVVALNGISSEEAGVPGSAGTVDLGENRGVSPGWNAAAAAARGSVLVFCNDDVVLGPGSLRLLHDTLMEHEEAGVVGPDGTLWDLTVPKHLERLNLVGRPTGSVQACEVLAGYLFAMRASVWEALGGFDEAYAPCSWEDVDLCTDTRLRLGLQCYAVAGVEVEHEYAISVTSAWKRIRHNGRSEFLRSIHVRNERHFKRKWREQLAAEGPGPRLARPDVGAAAPTSSAEGARRGRTSAGRES